jgi:alkylhydroperoxidase family enzyme
MMVLRRGNSEAKLADLDSFKQSDLFTDREKSALNYAEVMTKSDKQVTAPDRDWLAQHFSEDAVIELTALIAFQNLSSKFNAALDVQPQGFCSINPSK